MSHMLPNYSPTSLFGGPEVFCTAAPSEKTELCPAMLAAKSFADCIKAIAEVSEGDPGPLDLSPGDIIASLCTLLRELDPATATAQKRLLDVAGRDALFDRACDFLFAPEQIEDMSAAEILGEIFDDDFVALLDQENSTGGPGRRVLSQEEMDALLGFDDTDMDDNEPDPMIKNADMATDAASAPVAPQNMFLMMAVNSKATLCPDTTAAFIFSTFVTDTLELRQRLTRKIRTDIDAFAKSLAIILTGWKPILGQSDGAHMQTFRSALAYLNDHSA